VGTAGLFVDGVLVLLLLPWTAEEVGEAVAAAESTPLVVTVAVALVTGLGEEAFFRGALPRLGTWPRADLWATVAYTLSTLATGNLALILAAPVLGVACVLARRVTGRLWAAMLVHAVWSLVMVGGVPLLLV
ncbi:CPBP family glutamic-type intramembrane protease, partial [Mycetocola reblochoni]|uniref:CPBP family glutamic-type intramembrane protease n=1 Tax=Mycetocola reblochoni TaxID=331618 RepID=UPI003F992F2F